MSLEQRLNDKITRAAGRDDLKPGEPGQGGFSLAHHYRATFATARMPHGLRIGMTTVLASKGLLQVKDGTVRIVPAVYPQQLAFRF